MFEMNREKEKQRASSEVEDLTRRCRDRERQRDR